MTHVILKDTRDLCLPMLKSITNSSLTGVEGRKGVRRVIKMNVGSKASYVEKEKQKDQRRRVGIGGEKGRM